MPFESRTADSYTVVLSSVPTANVDVTVTPDGQTDLGAGASPDFTILRRKNGSIDTLDITAVLGRAPLAPSEAPDYEDEYFELKIRDMVFFDYNIFNLDRGTFKGVVIKEIEDGKIDVREYAGDVEEEDAGA